MNKDVLNIFTFVEGVKDVDGIEGVEGIEGVDGVEGVLLVLVSQVGSQNSVITFLVQSKRLLFVSNYRYLSVAPTPFFLFLSVHPAWLESLGYHLSFDAFGFTHVVSLLRPWMNFEIFITENQNDTHIHEIN